MNSTAMHDMETRVGDRAGAVLASPEPCALFIDIDGTLLGVAPTHDCQTARDVDP